VVADEQHRPVLGHVAEPAHLAPEPDARQQPQPRKVVADVVGVALVEVGDGKPARDLTGDAANEALDEVAARLAARLGRPDGDERVPLEPVARTLGAGRFLHRCGEGTATGAN
jgi:hypothetical protein